jgi:hypothetical protein
MKESLPTSLSNLEKGRDFLERKSQRMSRIEATLSGEAKTVMATKSRTRPRSIDWEGQMTLEGFTRTPRRQRPREETTCPGSNRFYLEQRQENCRNIPHNPLKGTVSLDKNRKRNSR